MVETGARAAFVLALVGCSAIVVWAASWPDHPLIPDEAIAKAMVESFASRGTPFAREPIDDYATGTFATDRYGGSYVNHEIASPPTSIAASVEQGALGVKVGRAATILIGAASIGYLGLRIAGPWAGAFAAILFTAHPAVLYFHQSYFANPGGTAWFLASLALFDAARRRPWLAYAGAVAAAVALAFRVEYAFAYLVLLPLAWLVFRDFRRVVAFYGAAALAFLFLWNVEVLVPALAGSRLFTEVVPLGGLEGAPFETLRALVERYRVGANYSPEEEWVTFVGHARDYFLLFFPLTSVLAVAGLLVGPGRRGSASATWVYVPLAVQTAVQAYAVLPAFAYYDYSNVSWLESSIVRYFLATYAFTSLLAAVALAAIFPVVQRSPNRLARRVTPIALAILVVGASISTALAADHGVAWGNERRAWFDGIDAAAADLDERAVFVGKTPGKVIFTRPLMNPENVAWDAEYATFVATDLVARGHRVFALEPWYWDDHGVNIESLLLAGGKTYWTRTPVVVPCTCGELARFYELHVTQADLRGVARVEPGSFADAESGLATAESPAFIYAERPVELRLGRGEAGRVVVNFTVAASPGGDYEAGYWNLPHEDARNRHRVVRWTSEPATPNATVEFALPAGVVANGGFYLAGPPGMVVGRLEVREE